MPESFRHAILQSAYDTPTSRRAVNLTLIAASDSDLATLLDLMNIVRASSDRTSVLTIAPPPPPEAS